jgi:uncharacterized protein (DUF2267 family)
MENGIPVDEHAFGDRVSTLMGGGTLQDARRAIRSVVAALGERLPDEERRALAENLPPGWAHVLHIRKYGGPFDVAEFYERVRRREGSTLGFAREHAQVVCRVMTESLPFLMLQRIERALPETFGELFRSGRALGEPPPHRLVHAERAHTLATGRPGSQHPVSESPPPAGHHHSIACSDNPHEETKLSSAHGLTQERLEESLATAHPDSTRSIAEASDWPLIEPEPLF